ncbi:PAPA-1-like conserved region domain containing protein [Rhypophila sp. PSN 637]
MSTRPRRSAAQRATEAITDMADRDNERVMSSRSRRSGGVASITREPRSSPASSVADSGEHLNLNVKMAPNKLRQATSGSKRNSSGGSAPASSSRGQSGRAARVTKKSYIVPSESDEEDEEEEEEEEGEDEIEVGTRAGLVDDDDEDEDEEDEEMGDLDGQGELDDEMDVDAEGEEDDEDAEADADGDIDMDAPPPPTIKVTRPNRGVAVPVKNSNKASITSTTAAKFVLDEDDDDEELSELESEPEDMTEALKLTPGDGEEDAEGEEEDMDAEGEEIEVADEDGEGEEEEELDSDDETRGLGSRGDTPDLTKLTARQRAKLGDASHEYLKLSDEVQAKKVFTAEELSMRRAEMARRRRNLSEKRNEEVKMETINKLLKKQAPKTTRRNAMLAGDETPEESARADPMFIRWVSTKEGNRVAVPDEMLIGPVGRVFLGGGGTGLSGGKMVQEVS